MRSHVLAQRRCSPALLGLILTLIVACGHAEDGRESRLSGAVAFAPESQTLRVFTHDPGLGYVRAHLRFGPELRDDVIMFVDQELLEGVAAPRWISGGDWMAFVGVQRSGVVWVGGGSIATEGGEPSASRDWKLYQLGQRLSPNTWYRLEVTADFAARRFVGFHIEGGDLDRMLDLSSVRLDYPNYMPFDRSAMIYIVGAMRGRGMMREPGEPLVYFDDVEGGALNPDGSRTRLFFSDFESQDAVTEQPLSGPPIRLDRYRSDTWYLERAASIFSIENKPFARSGRHVGVADAGLEKKGN